MSILNFALAATGNADTLTGILGMASEVVTSVVSWMGQFLDFIIDRPILLLGVILMFAGAGLGFLQRCFRTA